jgi:hypothetical protein
MVRKLHQASAWLLITLGVIHTSLTPVFYDGFLAEPMWFAGTGLAMSLIGILNIAWSRDARDDRLVSMLCHIANLIFALFGLAMARAVPQPQAYLGLVLILTMTVTSFLMGRVRRLQ